MPEPIDDPVESNDDVVERRVVHETVSVSSSRQSGVTIAIIAILAIALIVWIVMHMK
jgi:hypothetical protein